MKLKFINHRQLNATATEGGGSTVVITKAIDDSFNKFKGEVDGVKTAVKADIDAAKNEIKNDFETRITEAKNLAQKAETKLTELEQKMATGGMNGNGQLKSLGSVLEKGLEANKDKLSLQNKTKFSIELPSKGYSTTLGDIEAKAVGNMSSSGNLTGSYFVAPTVVPGVVLAAYNSTHVRDVLSIGNTNSNVVRHVRDNGGEGGPTTVAEGATKPQMDRDLSIVDANVRKIATYLRVPEEMIEDIPFLTSFLTNIGTEEVLAVEDTQILYGDGTGQNLSGLATNATAFAAGTSVVTAPNEYDVLSAAAKQMRVAKRTPTVHLVSPVNYYDMVSRKDTTNNYILQGGGNGLVPATAGGVPVMQMNQVTAGDFFTLDARSSQIFFRSNVNVRFYEQDQDNAIKNMVTIVIEERLALAIYFTAGIIKGTFAAAITDLTS